MLPAGVRRPSVVLLVVALVSAPVVPTLVASGTSGGPAGIAAGAEPGEPVPAATTPTDNDSVRHENPEEAGEDGDIDGIKGWLLGRLVGRLGESVINISQGQYDAARGLIGEETREYLSEYVDVAGDTEEETDDETGETVNDTVEEQEEFIRERENYSELYREYLEALENGNIERARRLLQELGVIESRLNRTGRNLTRNYRTIENRTGIDTGEHRDTIDEIVQNVSEIQEAASDELFDDTRIVIDESTASASVLDPIVVRGRVMVESGATDAGNEAPVTAGNVTIDSIGTRVTINETGQFTLRYRPPPLLSRGDLDLLFEYVPPSNSTYRSSVATVETTIESRQPTLRVSGPADVGFSDELSLAVNLTVDGRSIEGVPVRASSDETVIASTATTDGTTELSGAVPAAIDDGTRELRVTLPIEGRAIESATVTREIEVRETATRLRTNATTLSPTEIRVRGHLETVNGTAVPGQHIQIAIEGKDVATVRSNATGGFDETIAVPEWVNTSAFPNRVAPITTTFAAPSTNLGPASTNGTITVPTRPRIVIEESTTNASVLDPIVVRGRILVENKTPQPGDWTPVTIGNMVLDDTGTRVAVNETGHFTLRHRPVLLSRGTTNLTLEYVPPSESAYLPSTATFETTIESRRPTLQVSGPATVGFGDDVDLTANLTVDGRPIEGVPIRATIDGIGVASTTTANGTTRLSGALPAIIDDGTHELRVTLPIEGRAIESVTVTRDIRVRETDTRLDINVTALSADSVRVTGRLRTAAGEPVPDRVIDMAIAGEEAGGATTNATGGFAVVLTIPENVDADEFENRSVPVTASFAAPATNLGAASAETRVELPSGLLGDDGGLLGLGFSWWAWLALLVLSLAVAGLTYVVLLRRERESEDVDEPSPGAPTPAADTGEPADPPITASLLSLASDRLEAGEADAATQAGYAAVRERLAEQLDVGSSTHWELYRACTDADFPGERIEAVRRLVESYERAAFAPDSVPVETAREALSAAREALGERETASGAD